MVVVVITFHHMSHHISPLPTLLELLKEMVDGEWLGYCASSSSSSIRSSSSIGSNGSSSSSSGKSCSNSNSRSSSSSSSNGKEVEFLCIKYF